MSDAPFDLTPEASGLVLEHAMTLSGVIRRGDRRGSGRTVETAGSLRIETFEGSRSRLGQTRQGYSAVSNK